MHINFRKGIICKLGKDWNQRIQKGIQLPSKEGHLKQTCRDVNGDRFDKSVVSTQVFIIIHVLLLIQIINTKEI